MRSICAITVIAALMHLLPTARAGFQLPLHPLFTTDQVQEVRLHFYIDNFWQVMEENYEDEIYLEASLDWEDIHFDTVGVRFKGGSSYMFNPSMKKSFKVDLDQFVDGQEIFGVNKINLNCNYDDPSFVREICAYELCSAAGLPTLRRGFVALYINDIYWGLYTCVEQFNSAYIEQYFGEGEDGNLWKGDNYGTLEYLGESPEPYYGCYELKTNETQNDWTDLVQLTRVLNTTSEPHLQDSLSKTMDVATALGLLAVDNFTVNLDSYAGRCCNYYLYHMDRDDRFFFADWDMNESWGVYDSWGLGTGQLQELDPFWTNISPGEERPLAQVLWSVDEYREVYLGYLLGLLSGQGHQDTLVARMEELRDVARDWVYMEEFPRNLFSPDQFEEAMDQDVPIGPGRFAPALETFVRSRDAYLRNLLGVWTHDEGPVLNEIMSRNDSTIPDEYGEYDDWVEIFNGGTEAVSLQGYHLTDDMAYPYRYSFPDTVIQPGEHLVVWADDGASQGALHADFKLDGDGEELYLLQDSVVVDRVTFPELEDDLSYGRLPDGSGQWQVMEETTPGYSNEGGISSPQPDPIRVADEGPLSVSCPCPATGTVSVTVHGGEGPARMDLYDMAGRVVDTLFDGLLVCSGSFSWDTSGLRPGVYFMRLAQGGSMEVRSVTVLH